MAVIYYLNWDEEQGDHGPATELFHKLNVESVLEEDEKPSQEFTEDEFDDLYRELVPVDIDSSDDLEQIWKSWNRGSQRESQAFLDLRYCGRCDSYIEGVSEALTHAVQNHGFDQTTGVSEPEYMRGVRSMSIGDVVEIDGTYFQAKAIGWKEIEVGDQ